MKKYVENMEKYEGIPQHYALGLGKISGPSSSKRGASRQDMTFGLANEYISLTLMREAPKEDG